MSTRQLRANIDDALHELRSTSPGWMELSFAAMTTMCGAWSYIFPYASTWFGLHPALIATLFVLAGGNKLAAFFSRRMRWRRSAAGLACSFWAGVFVVLFNDTVPGLMLGVAMVSIACESVTWMWISNSMERGQ